MTSWRPEGWENPHGREARRLEKRIDNGDDKSHSFIPMLFKEASDQKVAYEAGADALLEALKKLGQHVEKEQGYVCPCGVCRTGEDCISKEKGTIVFIPDEKGVACQHV